MSGESYLLCALVPPGSIEAEVGRVQASMFADHGLPSAEAIPPLVPISFLDPVRLTAGLLSRLNDCAPAGWRIGLGDAGWVEGHLYLRVQSGPTWPALRAGALADCGLPAGGLFPVAEGFYLGCSELERAELGFEGTAKGRDDLLPRIEASWFSSGTLALMVLETSAPGARWWSDLHWEITEERPFRGRRER